MSANSLSVPFPIFNDIDGDPLDAGYIYIGTANLDPVTNPISVYFDADLTIPASQPIRTLNGFPSNSGSPARLYVNADDYSITVKNKNGSQVYTSANATDRLSSSLVTFTQSGTGAVQQDAQDKMRSVVSVKDFGAVGDGITDDSAAIALAVTYLASISNAIPGAVGNQYSGTVLEFEKGAEYYLGSKVSFPSRCHIKGNNAAIFTDQAITLCDVYGWETKISDLRFYNGTQAINFTQGNVDQGIALIENCSFQGQTTRIINSVGTYSTHLQVRDCKFKTSVQIIYTECDETSISGGWMHIEGTGVSYMQTTGHLYVDDVLGVPVGVDTSTYWFQLGDATNKVGNLSVRRFRFGGESACGYLKSYAAANSVANGIQRTINIQNCELWGSGNFDFLEIPNSFVLKNNHRSTSGTVTLKADSASAVSATGLMQLWEVDSNIGFDVAAGQYIKRDVFDLNGGGKNEVSTNSYFDSFSSGAALGTGGSNAISSDVWPKNNIWNITFGTKTTEPQLYWTRSKATGLSGVYTFTVVCQSDDNLRMKLDVGAYSYNIDVPGDNKLRSYSVTGILTTAANSIACSFYDVQDGVSLSVGHPILLPGNSKLIELTQASNSTTLAITNYEGRYYAASAPSDGYWYNGTKIYDITPTAGGAIGWICTATGGPGTWKTFGNIAV